MSASPTIDDFRHWLDGSCEVAIGEHCLRMTLIAAEPLAGSPREGGGFRLEFRGPSEPVLAQAVMDVSRPSARYDIFMVPIARDAEGARYEAVYY